MAANSGAIRMGKAFVEFLADSSNLTKGISDIKKRLNELGTFAIKTGATIGGLGSAVLAPLMGLLGKAAERGRDVQSLADQFNTTTQSISGLGAGFESAGISFESFTNILDSLSGKLLDNDALIQSFGLNTYKLARIPIDDALAAIADKFKQMTNPMQRAQLASQVFGSEWRRLMPYLEQGAAGIEKLKEEGKDFALDPETAKRGVEVMKGFNQIMTQFRYTLLDVGSALLPTTESIKGIVSWIRTAGMGVKTWIAENKEAFKAVALVGAGMLVAGTALVAFGTAAIFVGATITGIASIVGGLTAAVTTLVSLWPLLLVGGAVYAASALGSFQALKGTLGDLQSGFMAIGDTAKSTWEGISDALSKGDIALAGKVAFAGLELAWAQAVVSITEVWNRFKASFVDGWHDVVTAVHMLFIDLGGFIFESISSSVQRVLDVAARAFEAVGADETAAKTRGALGEFSPEGIAESTKNKKATVLDDAIKDERKRKAAREGDVLSAKADVTSLSAILEALKAEAKTEAPFFGGGDFGGDMDKRRNDIMGLGTSVKGGFTATAAAQQFGVGDKTDKVIDGLNNVAGKTDGVRNAIDGGFAELASALRMR